MRIRAVLLAAALLLGVAAASSGPFLLNENLAGAATAAVAFRFADPRIDEASGLAVGIRSRGMVYVQNDSGDSARLFAVDTATGRTLAVCRVPGARNVDWEDLATARDARGVPCVWARGSATAGRNRARCHDAGEDRKRHGPPKRNLCAAGRAAARLSAGPTNAAVSPGRH